MGYISVPFKEKQTSRSKAFLWLWLQQLVVLFERLIQAEKPFRLTNELPGCNWETSSGRSEIFALGSHQPFAVMIPSGKRRCSGHFS